MSKKRMGCVVISIWGVVFVLLAGLGTMAFTEYLAPERLASLRMPTLVPTLDAASIQLTLAPRATATRIGQQLPPTWTPTVTLAPSETHLEVPTETLVPPTATELPTSTPTIFITPKPFYEGPIVIGYSHEGRPIEVYRFGTGPVERMIVAGIHGGYESNTIRLATELINHLLENPDMVSPTVTLYILPALNPDGYAREFGFDGRVNDKGVDLNRNFPVNWAPDWNRDRCWNFRPTTAGKSPGSEPETQSLINFVENETRVTAIISYHSAALGIFPGGEPPHPASARLAESLAAVSTYDYPPVDTGCYYSGTLPDWAADIGIASVDLELHNHGDTDFEENLLILEAFLKWRRVP